MRTSEEWKLLRLGSRLAWKGYEKRWGCYRITDDRKKVRQIGWLPEIFVTSFKFE